MENNRGEKISQILKNVGDLGKSIKIPSLVPVQQIQESANAVGVPVSGTGFVRILMYFIAGILVIGILLLGVDQWVTPIFKKSPGAPGYIAIPGNDLSEMYWQKLSKVSNIIIGTPAPPPPVAGITQVPPLSTTSIEGQSSYSLSMDVLIQDEYPQALGIGQDQRVFFILSSTIDNPTIRIGLDNEKNTVYITTFDANGLQQSVVLDNVPIHVPFRIGIVITSYILEGYLNGLLVMTRQLKSPPKLPSTGDKIFAPSNIKIGSTVLSRGISVLNMRIFGYVTSSEEMKARMGDLASISLFNPTTDNNWLFSNN
jgi:hypothetical protein